MVIFSVVSIPAYFFFFISFLMDDETAKREGLSAFLKGMLAFVPILIIGWIAMQGMKESFSPAGVYLYYLLLDNLLYPALALAAFLLFYGVRVFDRNDRVPVLMGFLSAVFSLLTLAEWILRMQTADAYTLFLLPCTRIVIITALPLLFYSGIDAGRIWEKVLWFIASLLLPFITAFVSLLARMQNFLFAAVLCVVLLAISMLNLLLFRRRFL